ncbi:MAG: ubiquinone biosynthesis protein UbiB [Planctomycetota bacterium]|nr:MAG: ubiquinone biosynthesis protein UbiB [Planctomycetota bacterium]
MTPFQVTRGVRSLNRLRQIATVLTQQGFGHVVDQIELSRYLPVWMRPRASRVDRPVAAGTLVGRRLVRVCVDLGPTFVKFGQMLTTRPDIVPADVIAELSTLQDRVPPFSTEEARRIIEEDLGCPMQACFPTFGEAPLASGSIGQVYRAVDSEGRGVIVKVRRPGIEDTIRLDMHLLKGLAGSIESYVPELRVYRPVLLADEFEQALTRELDYINEASATARFVAAFRDVPHVRCPEVYWDKCSPRVLTLEELPGSNVSALLDQPLSGVDRVVLADRLANAYFRMIFELGMFQADPHPGNILVEPPADVGIIDFGQVGLITHDLMTHLVTMVYAAVNREIEVVADTLADLNAFGPATDTGRLEAGLRALIDKYYGLPLKRIDLAKLFEEISELMRGNDLLLPRELVLMIKALATVAGVTLKIDPDYNLLASLGPRLKALMRERFSARQVRRAATLTSWHVLSMARRAPRQLRHFLRHLTAGTWQFRLRHENLDHLVRELDRSSNRLAFSILIAAIIIGSSVVVTTREDLMLFGNVPLRFFGVLGYVFAGVLGVGLVWAIFRSGRLH